MSQRGVLIGVWLSIVAGSRARAELELTGFSAPSFHFVFPEQHFSESHHRVVGRLASSSSLTKDNAAGRRFPIYADFGGDVHSDGRTPRVPVGETLHNRTVAAIRFLTVLSAGFVAGLLFLTAYLSPPKQVGVCCSRPSGRMLAPQKPCNRKRGSERRVGWARSHQGVVSPRRAKFPLGRTTRIRDRCE